MKNLPRFSLDGRSVAARLLVGRILVDPVLPWKFDSTANEWRPKSHAFWWMRPYIKTYSAEQIWAASDELAQSDSWREARSAWHKAWPGGTRYDVRRLDGGAWDRSTIHRAFATLESAVDAALRLCPPDGTDVA